MRGVDTTPVIVEFLVALFPPLPFFPRGDLEIGDLSFAALEAAFLDIWGALAVNDQHGYMKCLRYLLAFFIGSAIGEGCIYHDAQAQA